MATVIKPKKITGDDATYNHAYESAALTGAGQTSWTKFYGPVVAGLGGSATSASGLLEFTLPDPETGAPGSVIFSDANGAISAANVSLGKTVDIYDLPAPVYVRWNISAVSGACLPFIAGRGW